MSNDTSQKLDINKASVKDFAKLPFLNEQRAQLIVDYREANGPFKSMEDIDNITGIGEKLSAHIAQHCNPLGKN